MNDEHPGFTPRLGSCGGPTLAPGHADQRAWPGLPPDPLDFLQALGRSGAGLVRRTVDHLRRRREAARAYRELMALDDRLLADIGLERSRIGTLVDEMAQRRGHDARRR